MQNKSTGSERVEEWGRLELDGSGQNKICNGLPRPRATAGYVVVDGEGAYTLEGLEMVIGQKDVQSKTA